MAKLTLKHPLEFGKIAVRHLTFREHTTAEDYLAFDKRGGVAQRIALISSLSGTDEELVKKLHGRDYQRAVEIVDALLAADDEEPPQAAAGNEGQPEDEATAAARKK
ncbi:phage tail assembly protein [Burkholderia metallica]|uniref:phage tail assembly protein n=1 Tax=Burkholderia metallica TaxID=488729 RepID=UPI00157B38D3|nr:phage tail assembly protein [Burkholderia metallica]NTZ82396.1 phage tail assembly protein [Burkholderia metallica]